MRRFPEFPAIHMIEVSSEERYSFPATFPVFLEAFYEIHLYHHIQKYKILNKKCPARSTSKAKQIN